jgi:hypothetical protein
MRALTRLISIPVLLAIAAHAADPTEVVLLGTLHGMHQQNPRYSLDTLRDLLVKLKPAAILRDLLSAQPEIQLREFYEIPGAR